MKDLIFDEFQDAVDNSLLRHRSILDILTKLQESESRVNRAIIKSVTTCGCIKINAEKQFVQYCLDNDNIKDLTSDNLTFPLSSHIHGQLCDDCKKVIEDELGNHLFYVTSLCNSLDLNLYDILLNEYKNVNSFSNVTLR